MATRNALKVKTTRAIGRKVDRARYQHALLGHPDGSLTITDKPGYGWARLGGQAGRVVIVYLRGVLPAYDLPVVVSPLPHRPQDYGVVDLDVGGFAGTGSGENANGYDGTSYLTAHAAQHAYLAGDQTLTHLRQWRPLRIYAHGGMTIGLEQGFIYRAGARVNVASQTLDLTSHIPGSGARYVLITLNASGTLTATDGTPVASIASLALTDVPATPSGHFPLAAVRTYLGQSAVRESRSALDIVDLRWPQEVMAGVLALTNTHIFVGNASNVATDVALSADATIANTGALTLATVNSNVGTFGDATNIPQLTINAKGLATAVANIPIVFPVPPLNVYNETLMADGASTTYYLLNVATAGTIRVYIDGLRQPASDDSSDTDIVTFTSAPAAGALLMFDYELSIP